MKKTKSFSISGFCLILLTILCSVGAAQAATFTVTNTKDSGAGSLRQAIINANALASDDTINFSLSNCPCTITLTSGVLSIGSNGSLTIQGLGATLLSVSGNHQSSVFVIQQDANAAINDLTITAGMNSFGGGIATFPGGLDLTLTNVTLSGNSATVRGGAISNNSGSIITLNNSTISGNSAASGGAITTSGGHVTLNNSTISGNTATVEGGAIWSQASVTLNNSTVSGNSAAIGGGIYHVQGIITLNNTIIANSTGGDCFNNSGVINASYSLIEDGLAFVNGTNNNNLTGDPLLGPLQNNGGPTRTHALLAGSIAIDAGNSAFLTDQRGFLRPIDQPNYANAAGGNGSDIGSFEVQLAPTTKEQCKNDGWKDFTFPRAFKNQGDCIQFVNTGK